MSTFIETEYRNKDILEHSSSSSDIRLKCLPYCIALQLNFRLQVHLKNRNYYIIIVLYLIQTHLYIKCILYAYNIC